MKVSTYVARKPRISVISFAPDSSIHGFNTDDWYRQLTSGGHYIMSDSVKFRNKKITIQEILEDSVKNTLITLSLNIWIEQNL